MMNNLSTNVIRKTKKDCKKRFVNALKIFLKKKNKKINSTIFRH